MICLYCGDEFETSRLTARYCADGCKDAARKERNTTLPKEGNKISNKGNDKRVCGNCGADLSKRNFRARYCNAACKQEAYRKRKARKEARSLSA